MTASLKDLTTKEVAANQRELQSTIQDHSERLDKLDGLERLVKKWWPWVTAFVSAVSVVATLGVKAVLEYRELDRTKEAVRREQVINKRVDSLIRASYVRTNLKY